MTVAVSRIKFFRKSGARLYLPEKLVRDGAFPFEDDDLVKIEIRDDSLRVSRPEWWEMLDWNEMRAAYEALPEEAKRAIAGAGLAPRGEATEAAAPELEKDRIPAA